MKIRRERNARFLSRFYGSAIRNVTKTAMVDKPKKKRVDGKSKMDITSKSIHSLKEELSEKKKNLTKMRQITIVSDRSKVICLYIKDLHNNSSLKEERIPTWITKVRRPWFKKSAATTTKKVLLIITGLLGLWF